MKMILLFLLMSIAGNSQVTITSISPGRTRITNQVNTLKCLFDNIGGAVVTIHVSCTIPLGYVYLQTTTPRVCGNCGAGGWFGDELGNQILWMLRQKVKGVVSWSMTDKDGTQKEGDFGSLTITSQINNLNLLNSLTSPAVPMKEKTAVRMKLESDGRWSIPGGLPILRGSEKVYRNGFRQTAGVDYNLDLGNPHFLNVIPSNFKQIILPEPPNNTDLVPVGGYVWLGSDMVVMDYLY